MTTIKIIVAHHKKAPIVSNDSYLPIHVGKKLANIDLGIEGDDTGDNISIKNPIYCEMSALYWAWKNLKADYIGLCHYRRYFTTEKLPLNQKLVRLAKFWATRILGNFFRPGIDYDYSCHLLVQQRQLQEITGDFNKFLESKIHKYDIVTSQPHRFACRNVRQHFEAYGVIPLMLLEEIVKDNYPDLYPYLLRTFCADDIHAANMFIMRYDIFVDYCKCVFSILEEHENRTIKYKYCNNPLVEKSYSRLSGYLAECLTNAFILKEINNDRRVLYVNTVFCSDI